MVVARIARNEYRMSVVQLGFRRGLGLRAACRPAIRTRDMNIGSSHRAAWWCLICVSVGVFQAALGARHPSEALGSRPATSARAYDWLIAAILSAFVARTARIMSK